MSLRKKLFFLCLTNNNDSLRKFAKRIDIAPAVVSMVISEKCKSENVRKHVDLYIAENIQAVKNQLSKYKPACSH